MGRSGEGPGSEESGAWSRIVQVGPGPPSTCHARDTAQSGNGRVVKVLLDRRPVGKGLRIQSHACHY